MNPFDSGEYSSITIGNIAPVFALVSNSCMHNSNIHWDSVITVSINIGSLSFGVGLSDSPIL